jgi:signal transduction histidine kinase
VFYSFGKSDEDSIKLALIRALVREAPDSGIMVAKSILYHEIDSIRAEAFMQIGVGFYLKTQYDSSKVYFKQALDIYSKLKDTVYVTRCLNNLGICSFYTGDYENAYSYHTKVRELRIATNDPQISSTYNNLGLVMNELGNYKEALSYYMLALRSKIEYKQFKALSNTLTNIANVYQSLGDTDSAISYELKNLRHLDTLPDKRYLSDCLHNLGNHYLNKNLYNESIFYTKMAFELERDLKAYFGLLNSCSNLSIAYQKINKYTLASLYLDSAFLLVPELDSYRNAVDLYLQRSKLDSATGNFTGAFMALRKYTLLREKYRQEDQNKTILDLENKYQLELKERKIKELEQDNVIQALKVQQGKLIQWGLFILVAVFVLLTIILYSQYRFKQKTAELLASQKLKLEELNSVKDKLFAVISHDLRNPVYAFSNLSNAIRTHWETADREQLKEFVDSLSDAADDLKGLLSNLLNWALIQLNRIPSGKETVPLESIVHPVLKECHELITQKRQKLDIQIEKDMEVTVEVQKFQIILRNIITNASKFSDDFTTIRLRAFKGMQEYILEVQDNGIGLTSMEVDILLQKDSNTKNIGAGTASKGSGLGIMLCKELLASMNGRLEIRSEKGKGSVFSIVIPYHA